MQENCFKIGARTPNSGVFFWLPGQTKAQAVKREVWVTIIALDTKCLSAPQNIIYLLRQARFKNVSMYRHHEPKQALARHGVSCFLVLPSSTAQHPLVFSRSLSVSLSPSVSSFQVCKEIRRSHLEHCSEPGMFTAHVRKSHPAGPMCCPHYLSTSTTAHMGGKGYHTRRYTHMGFHPSPGA